MKTVHEILTQVAATRSRNEKVAILKAATNANLLRQVLYVGYNPYYHYFINDPPVDGEGEGTLGIEAFKLLFKLRQRLLSGHKALKAVGNFMRTLDYGAAEVFKCILNKDFRMGAGVKTINLAFPGLIPTFDVMRAKTYDPARIVYPVYVSKKIDGNRAIRRKGQLFSRNGHAITGVDHILAELNQLACFNYDGELDDPDMDFEASSGSIRSTKLSKKPLKYYIFDIADTAAEFKDRLHVMQKEERNSDLEHVIFVPHHLVMNEEELQYWYKYYRNKGEEGIIIRTPTGKYTDARNYDWMKVKSVISVDLKILDFYEGTGKNAGSLGGIIVRYKGQRNKVGGGFSDKLRAEIWNNPEKYRYLIAEILFQDETKYGNMRHSRLHKIRYDKSEESYD